MVLAKLKEIRMGRSTKEKGSADGRSNSGILILEDDADQMNLLIGFIVEESNKLIDSGNLNKESIENLSNLRIIKANSIRSLEKATLAHKDVILALLDCNVPDEKDGIANDQFVKTGHLITGQHRAADVVIESLPEASIVMVYSLNRFQAIVDRFYRNEFNINIDFINKKDASIIKEKIAYHLKKHLNLPC